MKNLELSLLNLITKTSTDLPKDIEDCLKERHKTERAASSAKYIFDVILENVSLARQKKQPLCQDTGALLFFIKAPPKFNRPAFIKTAARAIKKATTEGLLRPNSVDSLTNKNTGNNIGLGSPFFHFEDAQNNIEIRLIFKGGGSENVGGQYSLPEGELNADRNLPGAKKCIIDAVVKAQGRGCAPGILGVCIGGDRATGYLHAKQQFLRKLTDKNPVQRLAKLEKEITVEANSLGIGPMGLGGKTTLLGCKIGVLNRHPASYFVTVSYMCWAFRRQGISVDKKGSILKWLY